MIAFPFPRTLALLAIASALPAQRKPGAGDTAPELTFATRLNFGKLEAKKLGDLRGSAVLLEFWGTH